MRIQKQDLEGVELGNQQLLFDFEGDKRREEDTVLHCIGDRIEKDGYAALNDVASYIKESYGIPTGSILQHISLTITRKRFYDCPVRWR